MKLLIVESDPQLAKLWAAYLERQGTEVKVASSQAEAIAAMRETAFEVIVLDLVLEQGSAIAVADYASYALPGVRVVFVTNTSFFSDGSIFQHIPNACAFLPSATAPEDLAAVIEHYSLAS